MLSALEEKQRLIELLNAYIDTSEQSVRVIFDLEQQDPGMAGLVLIAAPAQVSGDSAVAILGPKRMNYESAINAVSYIAQLLHRIDTGEVARYLPNLQYHVQTGSTHDPDKRSLPALAAKLP